MAKMTLRAARINAELTQKAAANKIGISAKTLGNWEKGTTSPEVSKLGAICDTYGVAYNDLIFLPKHSL